MTKPHTIRADLVFGCAALAFVAAAFYSHDQYQNGLQQGRENRNNEIARIGNDRLFLIPEANKSFAQVCNDNSTLAENRKPEQAVMPASEIKYCERDMAKFHYYNPTQIYTRVGSIISPYRIE